MCFKGVCIICTTNTTRDDINNSSGIEIAVINQCMSLFDNDIKFISVVWEILCVLFNSILIGCLDGRDCWNSEKLFFFI